LVPNIRPCPACNRSCLPTDIFCAQCGHRFPSAVQGVQGGALVCSVCGHRRSSFDRTCPQCATNASAGALQTGAQGSPLQPVVPPQSPTNPTPHNPYSAPPTPLGHVAGQIPHFQCLNCRNWVPQGTQQCPYCSAIVPLPQGGYIGNAQGPVQQVIIHQAAPYAPMVPYRPRKEKATAGILAILLGSVGAQRFYLGQTGLGILSIVFCWTYIPALIGLIEGIILLCMSDDEFHRRHG